MSPNEKKQGMKPAQSTSMDELTYWRLKILQFFHDPPGKPFYFRKRGGHVVVAPRLFDVFANGAAMEETPKRPDCATAGADRPVFPGFWHRVLPTISFRTEDEQRLTHPLAPGRALRPRVKEEDRQRDQLDLMTEEEAAEAASSLSPGETGADSATGSVTLHSRDVHEEEKKALGKLSISIGEWDDPKALRQAYFRLWRRFRETLTTREGHLPDGRLPSDLLWERIPADTRIPDHSIWDHLRVSSALAFLDTPRWSRKKPFGVPEAKTPWLFTLSLGPVQKFIAASRMSRDLWTSSILVSDLFLHSMAPLIERYGPDAILYPDLNGNPQFDRWLKDREADYPGILSEHLEDPSTFAGVLPNTLVAVLPRGGADSDHLAPIEDLAAECRKSMHDRWRKLADTVRDWLHTGIERVDERGNVSRGLRAGPWQQQWKSQLESPPLFLTWSAVPWLEPERVRSLPYGGALPAQDRSDITHFLIPSDEDRAAAERRAARLEPWMPPEVWRHYEAARQVFGRTELVLLQIERGFDYALTHHQLRQRHELRKLAGRTWPEIEEHGEKCTLCRERTALHNEPIKTDAGKAPRLDTLRESVRKLWREIDPNGRGRERLCGVCAFKRYLVTAGGREGGINRTWAGNEGAVAPGEREARVPFPSTTTIAALDYLVRICSTPSLEPLLKEVYGAFTAVPLERTGFPRALPKLAQLASRSDTIRNFLTLEPQYTLFPHIVASEKSREKDNSRQSRLERLEKAVRALRNAAGAQLGRQPCSRYALIRLDADNMGRLLLGDPEVLRTRWRDVLHPKVVKKMEEDSTGFFEDKGWKPLLDRPRLMGPSLHAFINRALADFSHRIVPWVVEREFHGCLVYSGGDDVLALARADHALPLVARLQQLFSAAWIVDNAARADAWEWRRANWTGKEVMPPHQRFAILNTFTDEMAEWNGGAAPIELPAGIENQEVPIVRPDLDDQEFRPEQAFGPVLAMLGTHQSLSAAVVFAHFKTPLSVLLDESMVLLHDVAKNLACRGAVAVARYSRGGAKECIALPWRLEHRSPAVPETLEASGEDEKLAAHRVLKSVQRGFEAEHLPGRLPYKLRTFAARYETVFKIELKLETLSSISGAAARRRYLAEKTGSIKELLKDVLEQAAEGASNLQEYRDELVYLWRQGIILNLSKPRRHVDQWLSAGLQRSVDGLLLCRALAGEETDEEEDET